MKCEEWLALIEEYFDGELKDDAPVAAHIASCRACADVWHSLAREAEIYKSYQRDIAVTPALWEGVRSRIEKRAAEPEAGLFERLRRWFAGAALTPRFSFGLAAALVVVTVLATIAVMRAIDQPSAPQIAREPSTPPAPATNNAPATETAPPVVARESPAEQPEANAPAASPQVLQVAKATKPAVKTPPSPARLVREAEQKYLEAIALLSRDVERRKSQLSPDVVARFEASMAQINMTIAETRRAVRENPSDPVAMQYMIAAYSKKVELLREMSTD